APRTVIPGRVSASPATATATVPASSARPASDPLPVRTYATTAAPVVAAAAVTVHSGRYWWAIVFTWWWPSAPRRVVSRWPAAAPGVPSAGRGRSRAPPGGRSPVPATP